MFRRIVIPMGFPAIAGLGLLFVGVPAKAEAQSWPVQGSNGSNYVGSGPSLFGSPYVSTYRNAMNNGADPRANAVEVRSTPEEMTISRLLSASGVPNDRGQLRWPIGLAILAAPGAEGLCEQIDALFEEMAIQAASGPVSLTLAEEARQAVKELRRLLLKDKAERFRMPLAVYQESERFLNKLDRAQQLLQAGMTTPGAQRWSGTEGSSTPESTSGSARHR
jgi:hypothetical protein